MYPDGANLSEKIEYKYGAASIGGITLFPYTEVIGIDGVRSRASPIMWDKLYEMYRLMAPPMSLPPKLWLIPLKESLKADLPTILLFPLDPDRSDWVSRSTSDFMGMNLSATSPDAGCEDKE